MELFPASSDDQWTLIKRVIDDCDYYLVIVAGRYGSVDSNGIGYTEKEYDYAVTTGKPVIAFLHQDPQSIAARYTDQHPELRQKLASFRTKVQTRMCKYWTNADELGAVVSRSYVRLIKTHPVEGWVKARYAKTAEDLEKVNQMHEQIRVLEQEVAKLRQIGRARAPNLAQGTDPVMLKYKLRYKDSDEALIFQTTWNEVFAVVAAKAIDLDTEWSIRYEIDEWIARCAGHSERTIEITGASFQLIKIQFFSLGLIHTRLKSEFMTSHGGSTHEQTTVLWELTDEGRLALGELLAAKRVEAVEGQ
jgi:hypothetical protein